MGATGWLIRRSVRRRWAALSALALIVALGGTGAFVAAGAADRSASAYGRYLERADVSDVVLNPSLFTTEIDRLIRDLPGVRSVTTDALLLGSLDDGAPRARAEFDADLGAATQVRGSADGRYSAMDRPALDEGRLPAGPSEVVFSADLAAVRGVAVGDVVPLSFWSPRDDLLAEPDEVVSPVGVERVTVVGIATLADEVLPDELYPRERLIVSPDIAARYTCLPELPPYDATLEDAVAQAAPPGCATAYRYYALELEGGAGAVAATLDTFLRESAPLNADVPPEMAAHGAGYYLVATTTADERDRVERSMQPTVTALGVLAAAVAAVTVAVAGLGVARELRRSEDDQRTWWRLGLSDRQRSVVLAAPMLVTVAAGVVVAVGLAWWLSPVAPVGSVRAVEPSPGRDLSGWVVVGAFGMAAACSAVVAVLMVRASQRAGRAVERERDGATGPSVLRRLALVSARPAVDQGVRAAFGHSRGAGLVVASSALAVGTFVAALVFGSSLSAMVSTPAAYGWPWDLAAMTGSGYGDLDVEAVETSLEGRRDVASWTVFGLSTDVTVDGRPVQAVMPLDLRPGIDFTVVEGRLPRDADEVALGARTAADLGVGVGDRADLDGPVVGPRRVTVTGIAVIPPVGQFQADRAAPGLGMVLPPSVAAPEEVVGNLTFVGIDLVPGADPQAAHADLRDEIQSWDMLGLRPYEYRGPVRPAEIVNVRSMRAVPLIVGGLLGASAAVGLGVSVLVSVRARRRELGILRALGFTGRQVGNSVRVQVLVTMLAALVIGLPLGLAAGRVVWRLFASQLGVATEPSVPGGWIAATVLGSVVLAIVVAALPARAAARIVPAAVLRSE